MFPLALNNLRFNLVIERLLFSTQALSDAREVALKFQSRNRETSIFNQTLRNLCISSELTEFQSRNRETSIFNKQPNNLILKSLPVSIS